MRRFFRHDGGVAAIEFALIAPFLAMVLLGVISGWGYYQQNNHMRDSVEVAGKYFLQGGSKDDVALSLAEAAWTDKPVNGTIELSRKCYCGGTAASCGGICNDGNLPHTFLTIEATSTYTDPFFADALFQQSRTLNEIEVVRVR